jgi:hypothetical protein
MNRWSMEKIYRETLAAVQYSSVANFYEYLEGQTPDARFGTSCGFQALAVGERLTAAGAQGVQYFMDGRHAAAICPSSSGELFLFDPYLLHVDPMNLSLATGEDGAVFDAYPFASDGRGRVLKSRLRVRFVPDKRTVSMEYMRLSSSTLKWSLHRYFRLRLEQPLQTLPAPAEIARMLYHPEQNNLSVRVLDCRAGTLTELIYPICYYHGIAKPSVEHLIVRMSEEDSVVPYHEQARFARAVDRMAANVGASSAQLIDFVLEGVRIYERHAPAQIDYLPYEAYAPQGVQKHYRGDHMRGSQPSSQH